MRKLIPFVSTLIAAGLLVLCSAGCTAKAKKAYHLQRADKFFASSQYAKAEIEYLNVLKFDPVNTRAIAQLGAIYYDQGRFARAYAYVSKARELLPNDAELHYKMATLYQAALKPAEAREELNWVLDHNPAHPDAPVLLAESINSRTNLEQVRLRLEKLSAQLGETASVQLALGIVHLREGDSKAAEEAFTRALVLDPKSSAAHYALGSLRWAQNDLKQADEELKTAAGLSSPRSTRRLSYADYKIRTGELEEGKRLLGQITKETPDFLPAWLQQAEIALAEKNYTNCASLLGQALARDSNNYEALLLRGRLLIAQGETAKAIADLERTSSLYERSAPIRYHLAVAYLVNKDEPKAFKNLNQAVAFDPNYAEAILLLAELNIRKGNAAAAITPLTELVKRRPRISEAHLLLAGAYSAQKDFNNAVEVLKRMMPLFPKRPQIPFMLGTALLEQKKMGEARQAFEKSRELSPEYIPALERLVDLDLLDKHYSSATERIKQQMDKYPKSADPWLLLAKVHMAQTNWIEAEAPLLKAIELNPGLRNPYLLLSQVYVASGKHQQALERLNGLVAKATNDISALMQIGMINDALTNFPAARDAYEKILGVNPNFTPALNNLAYLYSEHLGQPDKAYGMAEKARQLLPNDPSSADTLGWILYKRGDYNRALGLIEESAARLSDPEIQYHLGMVHYMLGDETHARVALEKSLQGSKDFSGKEEGRQRLAFLANDAGPTAMAELEKRVRDEPNDPIATGRLAAIYEQQGALDKAVRLYETALKQNPRNGRFMGRLAQLYAKRPADQRKALELAKEAHGVVPDDPTVTWTLGRLVSGERDYKWALSLLQDAGRKMAETPELLYDLAWAYYNLGQVEQAESTMRSAVQEGSSFPKAQDAKQFLAFVTAAKTTADAQKAVAQAQQVLGADSNYVPAIMIVAIVDEEQAKFEEAKRLYETVLTANPLFVAATRKLAVLCAGHFSDDPKAYDLAVKARAAFPQDNEVARSLGILAYRHGDYSRAAELLKEAAQNEDGERLYYLGMAHYKLKQTKESKDALQKALALNIQTTFADDAKRVLIELR